VIDVMYDPDRFKGMITLIIWLVILGVLGVGGFFAYQQKDMLKEKGPRWYAMIKKHLPKRIQERLPLTEEEFMEKRIKEAKQKEDRNYFTEIVDVMKKLDKSDIDIEKRLSSEGLSKEEIDATLVAYEQEKKVTDTIQHEENVLDMIKSMSKESGDVFRNLKSEGFSENELREAFKELSDAVQEKEEDVKKKAGVKDEE
jgi:SOS response regulatory protein OraA/RecX